MLLSAISPDVVFVAATVSTAVNSALADVPMPVTALKTRSLAVMSTAAPPDVIAPVWAVSVTSLAPALAVIAAVAPARVIAPALIVTFPPVVIKAFNVTVLAAAPVTLTVVVDVTIPLKVTLVVASTMFSRFTVSAA